jgi:UrcA family protein
MRYLAIATFAAAASLAAPAFAQSVEELTVTGHSLRYDRQTLSRAVSFADLDLTRPGDRRMLRARVNDTAGDICEELNEPPPSAANLGRSCQEIARREAMGQVRLAVAAARGAAYADAAFSDPSFFAEAPSAQAYGEQASSRSATFTTTTVTNGPVADTPENRARYGAPMSHAGKRTAPRGN